MFCPCTKPLIRCTTTIVSLDIVVGFGCCICSIIPTIHYVSVTPPHSLWRIIVCWLHQATEVARTDLVFFVHKIHPLNPRQNWCVAVGNKDILINRKLTCWPWYQSMVRGHSVPTPDRNMVAHSLISSAWIKNPEIFSPIDSTTNSQLFIICAHTWHPPLRGPNCPPLLDMDPVKVWFVTQAVCYLDTLMLLYHWCYCVSQCVQVR